MNPNSRFTRFESNLFGINNLRLSKRYTFYIYSEDGVEIEFGTGFMGEGLWSDPNSAMEVRF